MHGRLHGSFPAAAMFGTHEIFPCDSRLESDLSSGTVGQPCSSPFWHAVQSPSPTWLAELLNLPKAAGRTLADLQLTSLLHGFSQLTLHAWSPQWQSYS